MTSIKKVILHNPFEKLFFQFGKQNCKQDKIKTKTLKLQKVLEYVMILRIQIISLEICYIMNSSETPLNTIIYYNTGESAQYAQEYRNICNKYILHIFKKLCKLSMFLFFHACEIITHLMLKSCCVLFAATFAFFAAKQTRKYKPMGKSILRCRRQGCRIRWP